MTRINTKMLCKKENADKFFNMLLSGQKINKTYNEKTFVIANKGRIYFDDLFSVGFYEYEGNLYASLEIKTLQDRKAIKEFVESKENSKEL